MATPDRAGAGLDEAQLQAITERAMRALPGPWRLIPIDEKPRPGAGEILPQMWSIDSDAPEFRVVGVYPVRWLRADPNEAEFIAHAREDVPALLAALAEARDAARRATARAERYERALASAVEQVDILVAHHCGAEVDQRFCEEYGCGSLLELVAPLRAALAGEAGAAAKGTT